MISRVFIIASASMLGLLLFLWQILRPLPIGEANDRRARWRKIFRVSLLRRAYTRETIEALMAKSRFAAYQFKADGIGFEVQLTREGRP